VGLSRVVSENSTQNATLWYMLFGAKFFDLGLRKIDRDLNRKIAIIRSIGRDTINLLVEKYCEKTDEPETETNFVKMAIESGYLNGKGELHITTEELIDEFFTFYIGGMDTTAHLMGMCFYYLAIYPEMQERLRKEATAGENLDLSALNKLEYLDNFVNETNRHYGFMLSIFPREALKDHQLGHIAVKKGTVVMFNWLGNYYYEKYFPKPMEFNPDRWTDGGKAAEASYVFIPFSTGKRVCVGKRLALIETKLLIVKALRRFRIKLKEGYVHKMVQRNLYEPENPIPLLFEQI
jgi:cytochrome P450